MISIDYVCFVNQTGYAQAALANAFALNESGKYDVRINCIHQKPQGQAFSRGEYNRIRSLMAKPQNTNAVQVFHCIPDMHKRVANLRKKIGYATFESFAPPSRWIAALNRCDAVIAASKFNKNTFENKGVTRPIFHIPHCIDLNRWNGDVDPLTQHDRFTFLFVGTWRKRKGWDLLLEAWAKEFGEEDGVQLIIKTDRVDRAEREARAYLQQFKKDYAPVLFEKKVLDEKGMPLFFRSADCFICPTLGEGFGLPAIQSMAINLPVIITKFSGCCDYADEDRCYVLEPSGFMVHECLDSIPQFAAQKWPRIKVSDIREAMRLVIRNKEQNRCKTDRAYDFVQENYSYSKIVEKFDNMMESVYSADVAETTTI